MQVREAHIPEAGEIVKELWLPLAREMEEISSYNQLRKDLELEEVVEHKKEKMQEKGSFVYIAKEEGEMIGLASCKVKESAPVYERGDKLKINELFIKKDFRRKGAASRLLDNFEKIAKEEGCETIELDVNKKNNVAKELYREKGFETERERMLKTI